MKQIIKSLAWKAYLSLIRVHGSWVLDCREKLRSALFFRCYIQTFSLFPGNRLNRNIDIAHAATSLFFGTPIHDGWPPADDDQVKCLYEVMRSTDLAKETLSNYYLLETYYYSFGNFTGSLNEKSDSALKKAKFFNDTAQPISHNEAKQISKKTKSDIKLLKREIRTLNAARIDDAKLKHIEPVTITSSHLMFLGSLFSSLFLISGFFYNKILLGYYGISVGDFFSISDYVASSVDVIASVSISAAFGLIAFTLGLNDNLSEDLHVEQFGEKEKGKVYFLPFVILSATAVLVIRTYMTGEIDRPTFLLLTSFVTFGLVFRIPIWKFIKNKASVTAVIVTILIFFITLGSEVINKVSTIENGKYVSKYTLHFNKEYSECSQYKFVSGNSSYIFLWNASNRKIVIIPRSGVEKYEAR